MDVHVHLGGRGQLSEQIFRQLFEAILDGRLPPGSRLPPTRELAARLAVSRNTVGVAYERLLAEGVTEGRVGAGTFVVSASAPWPQGLARRAPAGAVHPRDVWRTTPVLPPRRRGDVAFDFTPGTPDDTLFPLTAWRRLVAGEFRTSAAPYSTYGHPAGHEALRVAIARHVGVSRAVRAEADDVVVTQGAQQAFDLVGRVLIAPGAVVAVEDPGYSRVRMLYRSLGARVAGVPVDDEGLVVDAIPRRARLVYVTPSHQFPLGTTMSLGRRAALLAWADRCDGAIVEDDYDTEFRFGGRPLDPLQSLDRAGRVIYVGSFSKVLLPALRVGFLVAPLSLQSALHAAKQLTDWHGDLATQAALARFIDTGLLARHIRAVTREYADRYARLAEGLERRLAPWLRVVPSAAGMHLTATVAPDATVDIAHVVARAGARGVAVRRLADFYVDAPAVDGLVMGYGGIAASRIDDGLARLAEAFTAVTR
ncbi:MAG: PLP-dependent aminotransferase family protein [Acidobacteria bacterium]|nr:PLP-dependent aminotransferase family protein [Acidobacteriota bacterium]